MTIESPIWQSLLRIRDHAQLSAIDRELLRPAFAALDGGPVIALPDRVIARIRDIDARLPKAQR
ncbi:hypothetical protein [Cupriavidus metallidurans]|uniref:hypothetical protein n=1 Tax=Cupriavidus metallidurans TaxID=119219 RepID=UPI000CE0504C|nr:hypothetical protein [Cupriavidus metallidurans]AVA32985.1 hypothetical protein C3Z06_04685 [Cupriavidus metallidurans]